MMHSAHDQPGSSVSRAAVNGPLVPERGVRKLAGVKSKTPMFSAMRLGLVDFGITEVCTEVCTPRVFQARPTRMTRLTKPFPDG